ncbi:MAG TPA: response regulator transcription factor [Terriglobia bacterium]|nr:response regulator transcription factor [Terriglobia bacterium]
MKEVKILVADDHELVRRGVRALIESQPGWEVCGEASTGRDAVEQTKRLKPDVVILDLSMPDLNGLEATRQILAAVPRTEVLVLTIHESEQAERDVLAAGARGYLRKSDDASDLVAAVDTLSRHRPFFTNRITRMMMENYRWTGGPLPGADWEKDTLSPREREVTQLLAEGNSNKEVATTLGISHKTIECHRAHIMRKLNLHTLSDLIHYAIRNGMVEP